jgi:hypothetical protein
VTSILTLVLPLLITLGAEIPLGNSALGPAVSNQALLTVASNGRDFVALWSDDRATPSYVPALYTGRIDASGRAVDPTGHLIAHSTFGGHLIWGGGAYLLVYMDELGHSFLQSIDNDGKPLGAPQRIDLSVAPRAFATNGRTLLTLQINGQLWLNSLADGHAIWKEQVGEPTDASEIAVLSNGDYRFVTLTNHQVFLITVDSTTGFITARRTLLTHADHMAALNLANGGIFLAWTDGGVGRYELVDLTQPVTFATDADGATVAAGLDGHQYAIALASPGTLRISRVALDGRLIDPAPFALAGGPERNVHIAASATDVLIAGDVLSDRLDWDLVARASHSFDDVAASQARVIASSTGVQQRPRVADGGLVLWLERDLIAQHPEGLPHTIGEGALHAGVGRGAASYLVAWVTNAIPSALLAKRLAFDGTPIDHDPLVLAKDVGALFSYGDIVPAVAFDGTNFLVVWPDITGNLFAMRVGQDGRAVDAAPLALTNFSVGSKFAVSPRVVWNGSQYVVVWMNQFISTSLISPQPAMPVQVLMVRVAPSGQVLDADPINLWQKAGFGTSLGLATNGNDIEVVWGVDCVYDLTLLHDGTPAGPVRTLACGRVATPDVAWDGSEYVAVWADDVDVNGLRLGVDDAPFVVSAGATEPAIAASPTGATIAYVRLADGVPRVFARELERTGAPVRRRPSR